jgi:hypothetical protein
LKLIRKFLYTKKFCWPLIIIPYFTIIVKFGCFILVLIWTKSCCCRPPLILSKVAFNYRYPFIRAAPSMFTTYKLALMIFNIYNSEIQSIGSGLTLIKSLPPDKNAST